MFGEDPGGESPRLPSPWRALSSSDSTGIGTTATPSPLSLSTASTPGLSQSYSSTPSLRRCSQSSAVSPFAVDDDDSPSTSTADGSQSCSYKRGESYLKAMLANEQFADQFGHLNLEKNEALEPEVDKSGHIEYKLKLSAGTPLRMAKLITQLKFRLVQGGGVALYELGVLDDGTLVGLSYDEMCQSLDVLGKMLAGLGGGTVEIGRVVRLCDDDEEDESCSSDPSSADGQSDKRKWFEDFQVAPSHDATMPTGSSDESSSNSLAFNLSLKGEQPLEVTVQPNEAARTRAKLFEPRSPEEKSRIRWAKKEERMQRKREQAAADGRLWLDERIPKPPSSSSSAHEPVEIVSTPRKKKKKKPHRQSKGRLETSDEAALRKPKFRARGEERFVVEAVVVKKGGRRLSSVDGDASDGGGGDSCIEEEVGWTHLEFDFLGSPV